MLGLSGARAVVLGISLVTMVAAWMLLPRSEPPPPAQIVQEAPRAATVEVLVASNDLSMGATITQNDIRWQAWPADSVPAGFIRRGPDVEKDVIGSLVQSSFLAALLPAGKRAVAINIDRSGGSTAGGFILPNDRVDVVRIGRQENAPQGTEAFVSETILSNIRVLAIGQSVQNRGTPNEAVTGETATLELDTRQVEVITLAQRNGTIQLALRSIADARETPSTEPQPDRQGLTLVRFGVTTQTSRQ